MGPPLRCFMRLHIAALHLTLPALAFGGPSQCADWDDLRVIAHQRGCASTSGLTTLIGEPAA